MIEVPLLALAALAVMGQGHEPVAARTAGERWETTQDTAHEQPPCRPPLHVSFPPVYHRDTGGYAVVAVQVRRSPVPCLDAPAMPPLGVTVQVSDPYGSILTEGRGQFTSAQDEATVLLDRPISATSVALVEAVAHRPALGPQGQVTTRRWPGDRDVHDDGAGTRRHTGESAHLDVA